VRAFPDRSGQGGGVDKKEGRGRHLRVKRESGGRRGAAASAKRFFPSPQFRSPGDGGIRGGREKEREGEGCSIGVCRKNWSVGETRKEFFLSLFGWSALRRVSIRV